MAELLEQVAKLAELQKRATPGPWFDNIENLTKGEWAHVFGPSSQTHTECLHWPNAAFIAAAGSLDFAALHAALSPAPVAAGGVEQLVRPVYAPGGVEVTVEEMLSEIEKALSLSYKLQGDEAYNYLFSSATYAVQVLRKQLAPAGLALAANTHAARHATPAAAVAAEAGGSHKWVPVREFSQLTDGASLLIIGRFDGKDDHIFHNIRLKVSESDGQEVILRKKGNTYFNFGMYARGESWVEECYIKATPTQGKEVPNA